MEENSHSRPSVLMTLALLLGVVVYMSGLLGLFAVAHISQPTFGFLFLLYWAAILKQDPKAYLPTIVGGTAGILFGAFLFTMFGQGTMGMIVGNSALAMILFFYMRQQLHQVINNAMMLYLTVASIPSLDCVRNFPTMIAALLIAALYMGAWSLAIRHIGPRFQARLGNAKAPAKPIVPSAAA